jgi:hypothetical protein
MSHDCLYILLITDMHQATGRQTVFDDDFEKQFNRHLTSGPSNIANTTTSHTSQCHVCCFANLCGQSWSPQFNEAAHLNLIPVGRYTMSTITSRHLDCVPDLFTNGRILEPF